MHIRSNKILSVILAPIIYLAKKVGHYYPKAIVKIRYFLRFNKMLDFNNPITLNEKILTYSLTTDSTIRTKLADKWMVREYIEECNLSNILVKMYGVWEEAKDIDFDNLPSSFVLKPNHGCGDIIIVKDKDKICKEKVVRQLNKDLKAIYGEIEGGVHYYNIKPRIIAEELLVNDEYSEKYSSSLIDYKIWCFNGKAHYILTCTNRVSGTVELMTYDREWNAYPEYSIYNKLYKRGNLLPKPISLDNMLNIAEALAKPFPVVRVDLYNIGGEVYFGEMTFTSLGGLMNYYSAEFQELAGNLIDLKYLSTL